jgi:hypothetical protein
VTVNVQEPQTLFEDRLSQIDARISKILRAGRSRIEMSFDAYNLTNAGTILTVNNTFGARWRQPTLLLPARMFKVGANVSF